MPPESGGDLQLESADNGSSSESDSDNDIKPGRDLGSRIASRFVESAFDETKQLFLPEGLLDELVTPDAAISFIFPGTQSEPGGKKVFAISICTSFEDKNLLKVMTQFRKAKFHDNCLPITPENRHKFRCFQNSPLFDELKFQTFYQKQWAFLTPVFSNNNLKLELHPGTILPFIRKGESMDSGSFGEVTQVTVHESNQTNPIMTADGRRADVAVKKIKQVYPTPTEESKLRALEDEWKREADEANLRSFWQRHLRPQMTAGLVRDVIKQLLGLANALNELHNYNGDAGESYRHGDLKPENILIVRTRSKESENPDLDIGMLKIADMGLAKHHTVAT
ncbi:hypothetical protein B0T19DRAFT_395724 [Cercophora scortea]|uniref:Protein kinase domain-containing protein n=1 Tax=Cercophora scortea TaxID=314031 RepID=A0AAE0J2Y5_9PEZI|nr:hypothetical protein B0T19DRAFT_395724 [Cercophora scortea]